MHAAHALEDHGVTLWKSAVWQTKVSDFSRAADPRHRQPRCARLAAARSRSVSPLFGREKEDTRVSETLSAANADRSVIWIARATTADCRDV